MLGPRVSAFFLSAVIFVAGVAGGVLLDKFFLTGRKLARYEHFKKFMGPKRFDIIREQLQKKFTRELGLDGSQQAQLRDILERNLGKIKARATEHDAEIETMKEASRNEVRAILTATQKERFEELVQDYQARRARGEVR